MSTKLKPHPASEIFPRLPENEFDELCGSIERFGQRKAIELLDGKILDGRHRYEACVKLGLDPLVEDAELEDISPWEYVWLINGDRRQLTKTQKALAASKMLAGLRTKRGRRTAKEQDNGASVADAAERLGVSPTMVAQAAKVRETGSPELVEAVETGKVKLHTAAKLVESPKKKQDEFLKALDEPKKPKPKRTTEQVIKDSIDSLSGQVARALDEMAQARGAEGPKYTACMDAWDSFMKTWKLYRRSGK